MRDNLVTDNLGLAWSWAKRLATHPAARTLGMGVEDLAQEFTVGLIKAADTYDPSRGAAFSTHATWRMRSVWSALREKAAHRPQIVAEVPSAAAPTPPAIDLDALTPAQREVVRMKMQGHT